MAFKTIIATAVAASIVSTSALACTPRYTSNVGSIMAQVRVQASKAGAAVKTSDNSYLQAALAAAAEAGVAAGSSVASGK